MRALILAPLLLLPIVLGGCAQAEPEEAAATRTARASASASATATATATAGAATPAPTAGADGQGGTGSGGAATPRATAGGGLPSTKNCGGPDLDIALSSTDSGAGNVDYTIAFTNRSRTTCHVSGAPRAYFIGADGDQLGPDADGTGREGDFVSVPPGRSAYTTVRAVNVGTDGGPLGDRCTPKRAVAIAIDAPNYDRYEQVPVRAYGCAEQGVAVLAVTVLRGGA